MGTLVGALRRCGTIARCAAAPLIAGGVIAGLAAMPAAAAAPPATGIDYPYGFAVSGQGSATYNGTGTGVADDGSPCSMNYTEQVSWSLSNVLGVAERPVGQFTDGNFAISNVEAGATNPFDHRPESSNLSVTVNESGTCPADVNAASNPAVCGTSTSSQNQFAFPLAPAPVQLLAYGNLSGGTPCEYAPFAGMWDGDPDGVGGSCTGPCVNGFTYLSGPADSAVQALGRYCHSQFETCTFPATINIGGSTPRSFCQGYGGSCTPPEQQGDGQTWQDTSDSWHLTITAKPLQTGHPLAHCVVPRLRGKTLRQATRALTHAHCLLGRVTTARSAAVPPGRVISSRPPAGARRPPLFAVALLLSGG